MIITKFNFSSTKGTSYFKICKLRCKLLTHRDQTFNENLDKVLTKKGAKDTQGYKEIVPKLVVFLESFFLAAFYQKTKLDQFLITSSLISFSFFFFFY